MKSSKAFSFIGVFALLVMAAGVTWAAATSGGGRTGEITTNNLAYLPIVSRAVDLFVSEMERDALATLYQSTRGDEWIVNNEWLGPEDHCSWYGVDCENGRVTRLDLHENHLSGSIPPELGNLTGLGKLDLDYNHLSGPIPQELGNLNRLTFLDLKENQLSGSIPPELGNLTNLELLDLASNQLSGPIPQELGNLNRLFYLDLTSNQLSCWETEEVLAWALSLSEHFWDDPPGTTVCQP